MMGQQGGGQDRLFYSFNLDEHVPRDHLLRSVNQFLDLSDLRQHLAGHYSNTGRPSIDPELMIRMLIIGYCFGIRSERRLCEEVHLNLAYRWFCRLGLEDSIPDHSVRADANRARGVPGAEAIDWKSGAHSTRAVREYVAALQKANPTETLPKSVSLTDPAARYTAAPGGTAFYAYSSNYLVDVDAGIIVDVEATPAIRTDEVNATRTMIDRVEAEFNLKPTRLIGDMAYGAAKLLDWMINEKAIEPHVPVWDKTQRKDATLSSSDFEWDELADEYRCPQGHALRSQWRAFQNPRTHVTRADTIIYRSRQSDCATCPLKSHCCPNTPFRKIARSVHESARDVARAIAKTNAYKQSRKDRKKVEMLFAHLKRIMKLDRLRLRGLSGAKDEFLMAAAVQNLRRMAKWLAPDTQNGNLLPA